MRIYSADFSIMDSGSARPVLGMVGLRFLIRQLAIPLSNEHITDYLIQVAL